LNLVRKLKEQYLPLEEIRDTMQRLTLEEVEELLAKSPQPPADIERTSSATEYIASVLNQTAVREEMKRKAAPLPPANSVPGAGYQVSEERLRAMSYGQPAASSQQPAALSPQPSNTWQRITIAPGIELHFAHTDDALTNSIAAQILRAAQDILDSDPGDFTEETE
jgi:hypothetical protein